MGKTILWLYSKPLNPEVGGIERISDLIMKGLRNRGHNCLNILVKIPGTDRLEYLGEEIKDVYSFLKDHHVDTIMNQTGSGINVLKCFLDSGGQKWKDEGGRIITCLHFHPMPVSVHYQFSLRKNKTLHDYYVIWKSWLFYDWLYKRDRRLIGQAYKYLYEKSDYFVMLSESYRNYIKTGAGIKDDSRLIAIGNPLTFEDISEPSILDQKENTILVVSRLMDWQKRVSFSIKAWEKLYNKPSMQNWRLQIVGDGEDMQTLRDYVTSHHIERVVFEGHQSPEPYYEKAKIFLMTSKSEGWGLTITESLQRGVVPIALDTSTAFHDIIDSGYNGYIIKDGSVKCLARKIEDLATDYSTLRQMGLNALESAKKFDIDEISKLWEKII